MMKNQKRNFQYFRTSGLFLALVLFMTTIPVCHAQSPVNVYTAGANDDKPCYWRGTTRIDLPIPSGFSGGSAFAITVTADRTVYTAGSYKEGDV
jgi:hypothetical protein